MEKEPDLLTYFGWLAGKYLVLTGVLVAILLFVDPNYFDVPIGTGEAGLAIEKAPPNSFATEISFDAESGQAIQMVLGVKDNSLSGVRAQLFGPNGEQNLDKNVNLSRQAGFFGLPKWEEIYGGSTTSGKYTLRLSQNSPGRIKVYFFQGPFVVRMILLPIFTAVLLFILEAIFRRRRKKEIVPLPQIEIEHSKRRMK